jgi:hypothetical protein
MVDVCTFFNGQLDCNGEICVHIVMDSWTVNGKFFFNFLIKSWTGKWRFVYSL